MPAAARLPIRSSRSKASQTMATHRDSEERSFVEDAARESSSDSNSFQETAKRLSVDSNSSLWRASHSYDGHHEDSEQTTLDPLAKDNPWEERAAYFFFFILGSSFLLPWNSLLVSTTYFGSRLAGSQFAFSYMNFVTVVFTVANVMFLWRATFTQLNSRPTIRIFVSLAVVTTISVALMISTRYSSLDPNAFFAVLIIVTIGEAFASSYLQNSVIGLSSWFGSNYLQAILSGQGAIGALVSLLQLLASIKELGPKIRTLGLSSTSSDSNDTGRHIRNSSFTFFIMGTAFCLFALLCFLSLLKLPFYKQVMQRKQAAIKGRHQLSDSTGQANDELHERLLPSSSADPLPSSTMAPIAPPTLRRVEPKIRLLGFSVFWNFFVTLSVFPSITGFILSSNDPDHSAIGSSMTAMGGKLSMNWYKPIIFIPIHFVIFNFGDWFGRVLPQLLPNLSETLIQKRTALTSLSLARTCFVPLFLLCNVEHSSIVVFRSDLIYLLILSAFAISNGYVSTLIMIAGVLDPSLELNEVDVSATCLSFYLTSGLAAGSLISFAVKALVVIL